MKMKYLLMPLLLLLVMKGASLNAEAINYGWVLSGNEFHDLDTLERVDYSILTNVDNCEAGDMLLTARDFLFEVLESSQIDEVRVEAAHILSYFELEWPHVATALTYYGSGSSALAAEILHLVDVYNNPELNLIVIPASTTPTGCHTSEMNTWNDGNCSTGYTKKLFTITCDGVETGRMDKCYKCTGEGCSLVSYDEQYNVSPGGNCTNHTWRCEKEESDDGNGNSGGGGSTPELQVGPISIWQPVNP